MATPLPPHPRAQVALETTLLVHGVPREAARGLAVGLSRIVHERGAVPRLVGVIGGKPVVGMNDAQLDALLSVTPDRVHKANTSNLGALMARGGHAATTVSSTMELAAGAGVSVFATGGIGGVHPFAPGAPAAGGPARLTLDISSDLTAFTRFPVAVVTAGVKSILDVAATRELLETLGVPVVGFRTDDFPAFYLRRSDGPRVGPVDARFDDVRELAAYCRRELSRTARGVVVCNPISPEHELTPADWARWLAEAGARAAAAGAAGRAVTPAVLGALHEVSGGATLRANIALVEHNAAVAADLARAMAELAD